MNTNEIQLIEKFGTKLDGYAQVLAEKAGQGVEHFWPVLIKQQPIEGIQSLVWLSIVGLFLVVCWGYIIRSKKPFYNDEDDTITLRGFLGIFGSILSIVFLIAIFNTDAIGKVVNPEYYAIKSVVQFIK